MPSGTISSIRLFVAPAAAGKTAYVVDRVRKAARRLEGVPRVVVPSRLQARALRRRLAETGGAIGIRVLTFDRLVAECLREAGEIAVELSEPVRYRLIRAVVDSLPLQHYRPLTDRPGFVGALQGVIRELKAGMIPPHRFARAVADLDDGLRLRELAAVYAEYQRRLQRNGWADREGLIWLAVDAVERNPQVGRDWPLLAVDGFDDLTPAQLALLARLARRVGETVVTLTGDPDSPDRPLVHRRFRRTRRRLEEALGVQAEPLPGATVHLPPPLAHLEAHLFSRGGVSQVEAAGAVERIEAPDRAAEVRVALRWLKARLVEDGMGPGEVALLARDVRPYRPFILQTAAEFGLPVRLVDGLPLRANPAVAALLDLLRLMLPRADSGDEPALPRRPVIEAWRSPYFDWSGLPEEETGEPIGITLRDADRLDAAARWGRVIEGLSQWEEALTHLVSLSEREEADDEQDVPAGVPVGQEARDLLAKFRCFVRRLTPPRGEQPLRAFVGWLEDLIGDDPALRSPVHPSPEGPTSLRMVEQVRAGEDAAAEQDVAALRALKDVLRGLVWAEEALVTDPVDFPRFFDEFAGAVEAATYRLPIHPDREEILVANVAQARGLPFRAVAVLGLAEGEFPATLSEDPFLRDADRRALRDRFDLPLLPSTESAEAEYFYETVTRPRERLLLTRPRLADTGGLWQPSPFWEEVGRLVAVETETVTVEALPAPDRAASWPELLESLAAWGDPAAEAWAWVRERAPERMTALEAALEVLHQRLGGADNRPFDGDLTPLADTFTHRFGPDHLWSASRLEAYRDCPFRFFVAHALGLEPREEPQAGLDARRLGSIYHRLLEATYKAAADPTDRESLLAALEKVAGGVLDEAPEREGFRETAWWAQTREEIVQNVRRSLEALAGLEGDFTPHAYELPFGLEGVSPLVVEVAGDGFRLRGVIDRVDRASDGSVRVIDYKTAGPSDYRPGSLEKGKKIQLPLYALAARDALGLGKPVEGFYWHVRHAEPSGFTLSAFGPEEAMELALRYAWEAVRGARAGLFVPAPPADGCPGYCPAVGFCWHYRPRYTG
ncbi:MAG TPA: PD-(D/E)XK nuclease family protein [Anaerolineales bacterium]|nr:PD-(D/E)XK nuclease family protein [Anaerolineales bacterium]